MSLFTVEQIELIRRLRQTGITGAQVVEAFDQLEKMDHDLSGNGLGDMGSPLAKFAAIAGWQNFAAALAGSASHWNPAATAAAVAALGARQHLSNGIQQRHSPLTGVILNGASPDSSSHALKIESSPSSHTSANAAINSSMEEGSEFTQLENPQDLEDLLQKGEIAALDEIRRFIAQYNLRQQTIATMTKISQPYVSKFLKGDGKEISSRIKHAMYAWYLNCRSNPQKLAQYCLDPQSRLSVSDAGEVVPQRRERFVFRPLHVRVLEQFFHQDAYPDMVRREEIANACNQALQLQRGGASLLDREMVTTQIVANWFANRRKEQKKREGFSPYHPFGRRGRRPSSLGRRQHDPSVSATMLPSSSSYNFSTSQGEQLDIKPESVSAESDDSGARDFGNGEEQQNFDGTDTGNESDSIDNELNTVNSSVMSLLNPYNQIEAPANESC